VSARGDRGAGDCPGTGPLTRDQIVSDLLTLGVEQGRPLLVHASLRSIGWVDGGAAAVVAALREAVGGSGTVVVPTATEENSLTSRAHRGHEPARGARVPGAHARLRLSENRLD
jgi:aminoglycoside 3-N-acetyltransferase